MVYKRLTEAQKEANKKRRHAATVKRQLAKKEEKRVLAAKRKVAKYIAKNRFPTKITKPLPMIPLPKKPLPKRPGPKPLPRIPHTKNKALPRTPREKQIYEKKIASLALARAAKQKIAEKRDIIKSTASSRRSKGTKIDKRMKKIAGSVPKSKPKRNNPYIYLKGEARKNYMKK